MKNYSISCVVFCFLSCTMQAMEGAIEGAANMLVPGHIMAIAAGGLFEVEEGDNEDLIDTTFSHILKLLGINDIEPVIDDQNNNIVMLDRIKEKSEELQARLETLNQRIRKLEKKLNNKSEDSTRDEWSGDEMNRPSPQESEKGKFNRSVLN